MSGGTTSGTGSFGSYGSPNMGGAASSGLSGYQGGLLGAQTDDTLLDKLKSKEGKAVMSNLGKALTAKNETPQQNAPSSNIDLKDPASIAKLLPYIHPQYIMPFLDLIQKAK